MSRDSTRDLRRNASGPDVSRKRAALKFSSALIMHKKKPGPCGPGCSLADRVGNHLPEGNSWLHRDHHLGGTTTVCLQRNRSMCLIAQASNAASGMSAMHESASNLSEI